MFFSDDTFIGHLMQYTETRGGLWAIIPMLHCEPAALISSSLCTEQVSILRYPYSTIAR